MNTFILILIGLNLGVPIRCYEDPVAWEANKIEVNTNPAAVAYYYPAPVFKDKYIALGPKYCKEVRRPTLMGAFVLAHEIAHAHQDMNGTPFNEQEADDLGRLWSLRLLHQLEKYLKRKAPPLTIDIRLAD